MDSISLDDRSGLPLFDIPLDDSIDHWVLSIDRLMTVIGSPSKDKLFFHKVN